MSLNENYKRRIIMMRGLGYRHGEIADKLGISRRTVQYHLNNLKRQATETDEEDCDGIEKLFWKIMLNYGSLGRVFEILNEMSDRNEITRKIKKQN